MAMALKRLYFLQNGTGICFIRHAPVTTWRQTDITYLRPGRQCAAFKLLRIKTPEKYTQPLFYGLFVVTVGKGLGCEHKDLFGAESIADKVVNKKVMQFIRADYGLGLLCNGI